MTTPVVPVASPPQPDIQELLSRIFNSANWRSEVEKTVRKNAKLLSRNKDMQAVLDKIGAKFNLETGEPKEGKLLTKDEAADWTAFQAFQKKPAELKTIVEEHGKFKVKESEQKEEEAFADAAEALEFENVPALTRWLVREKLLLEFKDQRVEDPDTGKKVLKRMPYVRPKENEKAALEPLEDYIEREVPDFVDTFRKAPESDEDEDEGDNARAEDELDTDALVARASAEAEGRVGKSKNKKQGVRIPATRGARSDTQVSRNDKILKKLEDDARGDPLYAM